jgi:hypothetical protein
MPREHRAADGAAVVLAVLLALAATLVGVRTGWHPADADELVYRETLVLMRHGADFYRAQATALIAKEHRPPTSVRAIRPPTLYLALRWLPPASWRWAVGLVYLADLLLVWRLARAHGPPLAVLAVAVGGIWLLGFAPYLFLHAEVWGLPFFLAGLLSARARRPWAAAALFLLAACIRELYAIGLVAGVVWEVVPLPRPLRWGTVRTRVRPWVTCASAALALYAVHSLLAERVLSATGYNARFANEHRTLSFVLRLLSPISSGPGELFGVMVTALGIVGAARVARRDPAAWSALISGSLLLVASVWVTRVYWSACWALPLAAFAPAALPLATGARAGQAVGDAAGVRGRSDVGRPSNSAAMEQSPSG